MINKHNYNEIELDNNENFVPLLKVPFCQDCGGKLNFNVNFDKDKSLIHCQYCGATYLYENDKRTSSSNILFYPPRICKY